FCFCVLYLSFPNFLLSVNFDLVFFPDERHGKLGS
ncbi:unnamed protein product, partial [Brassica oleracea var. botrytis]